MLARAAKSPDVLGIAEALCPAPVRGLEELNKGGNSRIYKVETDAGAYALKRYPLPSAHDPRNRLRQEMAALRFMERAGIMHVPRVIASDKGHAFGLFTWCEGEPMIGVEDDDIPRFATFLCELGGASQGAEAEALPYASEACISAHAIVSHIQVRLEKLRTAAAHHAALNGFLSAELLPHLEEASRAARAFDKELHRALQVLIPSDFGSHNCLRRDGALVFLDFEYFGWDDPATSTANFLLHPAMALTQAQKQEFTAHMDAFFEARDPHYSARLRSLLPLYAIRWATIILGEFIPEMWAHRIQSGKYLLHEHADVLAGQLKKARQVLLHAHL